MTARRVAGQAMLEYLLLAGTVIAVLMALNGAIRGALNRTAAAAGSELTATGGTADGLLR